MSCWPVYCVDMPMPLGDGSELITHDSWLTPQKQKLIDRMNHFKHLLGTLTPAFGSLDQATRGKDYFGLNRGEHQDMPGWWYREWAPHADQLNLIGDFNAWGRTNLPLIKDKHGVWSIFIPNSKGVQISHGMGYKVKVHSHKQTRDRIPAWADWIDLDPQGNFIARVRELQTPFTWKNPKPKPAEFLKIYEAHIGMSSNEPKVATYGEFQETVLPRIAKLGYNAIQLMAIMEHPYYGSFGYQVSNFFAPSHRYGLPEDLQKLIDAAHGYGIIVLLDIVHSHAVTNINEGLNEFDGSDNQYFHSGARGWHPAWGTRLFNYGSPEVLRFLLSNIRHWLEFGFDGFRFDGVTSMLYEDHGHREFNNYDEYFTQVNQDALAYVQLANLCIKESFPHAISIAEEVSGMPGLARPVVEGGLGFDYRLAMGIPDFWIKTLKNTQDQDWSMNNFYQTLTNRRQHEKHIAYVESHDQALVGDKTAAFWLMDAAMYTDMGIDSQNPVIDRGIALHKLFRLITLFLGGEGWLSFMGNEFGHPEWVDFPREGNNYSYHYARRQWSLADNPELRYQFLQNWDQSLMALPLGIDHPQLLWADDDRKILITKKAEHILAINFHPDQSWTDVVIPSEQSLQILLCSDDKQFGGWDRVETSNLYTSNNQQSKVYLPSRVGLVLKVLKDHNATQ